MSITKNTTTNISNYGHIHNPACVAIYLFIIIKLYLSLKIL